MSLTRQEYRAIAIAAHESFIASGKPYTKELAVVPACALCGHAPTNGYHRFSDGTVQCTYDRRNPCAQAVQS